MSLLNRIYFYETEADTPAVAVAKVWTMSNHRFKKLDRVNLGYRNTIVWMVIPIHHTRTAQPFFLEVGNPHLDKIALYSIGQAGVVPLGNETGDDLPFSTRSFTHRNFVWLLNAEDVEGQTLLLKVDKRNSSLRVPISLWEVSSFREHNTWTTLLFGICFGMMTLVGLYSLFAALLIRARIYVTYFLLIVFAILFLATGEGLSFQFLYPTWGGFNSIFRVLIASISTVALLLFSVDFLNLKKQWPFGARLLYAAIFAHLLFAVSSVVLADFYLRHSRFFLPVILTLIVLGGLTCLYAAVRTMRSQKQVSLFYVAAYSTTIISGLLTVFEDYGWIEELPFNIMFAGALTEILVFKVALTLMMQSVYRERNTLALEISKHQRQLLQSYLDGVELERQRISRELHDDIGSRISYLKRMAEAQKLNEVALPDQLQDLAEDIRRISHKLAPPQLLANDFTRMVDALCAEVKQTSGAVMHIQYFEFPDQLSGQFKTELYRILQEALQNIVKHAKATMIDLEFFRHQHELVVSIEDDGVGFDSSLASQGIGLRNMNLRAESLHGKLEVSSSAGRGTTLLITLPFSASQ